LTNKDKNGENPEPVPVTPKKAPRKPAAHTDEKKSVDQSQIEKRKEK
jgi:hypothetical protein